MEGRQTDGGSGSDDGRGRGGGVKHHFVHRLGLTSEPFVFNGFKVCIQTSKTLRQSYSVLHLHLFGLRLTFFFLFVCANFPF